MINLAPFSIRRMQNLIGYGVTFLKESNDLSFWYGWLSLSFVIAGTHMALVYR